jgi:predicted nucleic acid-binding protein
MRVLVDTSVWSLALRRKGGGEAAQRLADMIEASLVVMIGPVRQEILSGISNADTFNRLSAHLDAFEDFPITTQDHVTAAQFYNTCRKHGIQGSHTDFLICAVAHRNNLHIFTTDKDFESYAEYLPILCL